MTKYRVNKTADQVSQLAQNIRTLYASQKSYNTLNSTVIKKAHLAPEDMYDNTNSTTLYNPFGGQVSVSYAGKIYDSDAKAFYIGMGSLPQEACIELLTQDWGSGSSSGLIAVGRASIWAALYNCSDLGSNSNPYYRCAKNGVIPVDTALPCVIRQLIIICIGNFTDYII